MVTCLSKVNFISLHLSFNRPFLQGTGRKIMIQGLSRIFLPVPCKKGRLKRKWSEIKFTFQGRVTIIKDFQGFPTGALQKGRLNLKWSEIASNGARCLSFLKECPLDPPKSDRVQPNFFGGSIIPIKNTIREKPDQNLPFKLSAVVRAIYRRLYGVAATN